MTEDQKINKFIRIGNPDIVLTSCQEWVDLMVNAGMSKEEARALVKKLYFKQWGIEPRDDAFRD